MKKAKQQHGFEYEKKVIEKYNLKKTDSYVHKWDAYFGNIPVSIKTKKIGTSVEMGDIFRNANNKEDFILIIGFWDNFKDNIVEEKIFFINANFWKSQFNKDLIELLKYFFDGITNDYKDDEYFKEKAITYKNIWDKNNSIININFKRDHKNQKRIQCSIKNESIYNVLDKYYSTNILK